MNETLTSSTNTPPPLVVLFPLTEQWAWWEAHSGQDVLHLLYLVEFLNEFPQEKCSQESPGH
jgi:hypothetical protein